MKGLLWKELYQLKSTFRAQMFSLALFTVMGFMMKASSYIGMMVTVFLTNLVMSSMSYDEACCWNRYAMTMPVRRRDLATVKFVLLYILALGSLIVTVSINLLLSLVYQLPVLEGILTSAACTVVGIMSMSIDIPLCLKYGTEKARFFLVLSYLIPFLPLFVYLTFADGDLSFLNRLSSGGSAAILIGLFLMVAGISFGGWKVSCRLTEDYSSAVYK